MASLFAPCSSICSFSLHSSNRRFASQCQSTNRLDSGSLEDPRIGEFESENSKKKLVKFQLSHAPQTSLRHSKIFHARVPRLTKSFYFLISDSTHRWRALNDIATVVTVACDQPEPLASLLVFAELPLKVFGRWFLRVVRLTFDSMKGTGCKEKKKHVQWFLLQNWMMHKSLIFSKLLGLHRSDQLAAATPISRSNATCSQNIKSRVEEELERRTIPHCLPAESYSEREGELVILRSRNCTLGKKNVFKVG